MKQGVKEFTQDARPILSVEIERDFEAIKERWQAFQRSAAGGPHDTWEWNHAWAQTAGKDTDARIAIGHDADGRIVFILPLAIRTSRGCRVLEWFASKQGNYSAGLFDTAAWEQAPLPRGKALLDIILKAMPWIDAVHLEKVPESIEGKDCPLSGVSGLPEASPGHCFDFGADWEQHYNDRFNTSARSKLRRNERRLSDGTPAQFVSARTASEKITAIDGAMAQKAEFFAERGIRNFFRDRGVAEFFHLLARLPENDGDLSTRIYTCEKGGELLAAKMGVVYRDTYYGIISSTTASPIRRYGPGSVLFRHSVAMMCEDGVRRLDCGAGEDETKLKWCTERRERFQLLEPVSAKGYLYTVCMGLMLRAKLIIKNHPDLWDRYKRFRKWLACYLRPNSAGCDEAAPVNQQPSAAR